MDDKSYLIMSYHYLMDVKEVDIRSSKLNWAKLPAMQTQIWDTILHNLGLHCSQKLNMIETYHCA